MYLQRFVSKVLLKSVEVCFDQQDCQTQMMRAEMILVTLVSERAEAGGETDSQKLEEQGKDEWKC